MADYLQIKAGHQTCSIRQAAGALSNVAEHNRDFTHTTLLAKHSAGRTLTARTIVKTLSGDQGTLQLVL